MVGSFRVFTMWSVPCLYFQEVLGLDVALVGLLGGIDLEDANLRGVFGTLHREEADDTWLALYTLIVVISIIFQPLRCGYN